MAPTLAQLRMLVEIVRCGSFGGAAAELGVSQSSLSEGIRALERATGQVLLKRSRVGVSLTPAGERGLEHARRAVQAGQDFAQAVSEVNVLSGRLKIVAVRSAATYLLPPVMASFLQAHPRVDLQVVDTEIEAEPGAALLARGQADIAVFLQPPPELMPSPLPVPLLSWPYHTDEFVAVLRRRGQRGPLQWAELDGTLILNNAGFTTNLLVTRHLAACGVAEPRIQWMREDSVVLAMVQHGLGFTILPRLATLPLPAGLSALPLPSPLYRTLTVNVLPQRAGLPVIAAFLRVLQEQRSAAGVE